MSLPRNLSFAPLFLTLVTALFLLSFTACAANSQGLMVQAAEVVTNEAANAPADPTELVFAGQVEDENGRWLNNCVVILFKNGEEVTRTTTNLRESAFSSNGPMDGVFELRIPNVYKLSENHNYFDYPSGANIEMRTPPGTVDRYTLGIWLADLNPANLRRFQVPSKQVEYAVVVLPMPLDELPDTHQPGKLTFQDGLLIVQPAEAAEEAVEPTEEAGATLAETNIQFTLLPPNGQAWNLKISGYYGNRWDVWEKYVAGRGTGMSWETFKVAVLAHNPHLEDDGYVFYPEKSYLLPPSQ